MIQLAKGKNAMAQPVTSSGLLEAPKCSISTDCQETSPRWLWSRRRRVFFGTDECNQESILLFFSATSDAEFDAVFESLEDTALGYWFHLLQGSMEIKS